MSEEAAFGYIAHQQFHDNRQFVHGLVEARRGLRRRRATNRLLQVRGRCCVVELNRLNPAKIVVVAGMLRVPSRSGKGRLRNKLVGLVVQAELQIAAEYAVNQRRFSFIVVAEGRSTRCGEEESAEGLVSLAFRRI